MSISVFLISIGLIPKIWIILELSVFFGIESVIRSASVDIWNPWGTNSSANTSAHNLSVCGVVVEHIKCRWPIASCTKAARL